MESKLEVLFKHNVSFVNSNLTKLFYRKKKLLCTVPLGMDTTLLPKRSARQAAM